MISCETKNAEITADSGEPVLGHNNSPIEGTDKKPLKWTFFIKEIWVRNSTSSYIVTSTSLAQNV